MKTLKKIMKNLQIQTLIKIIYENDINRTPIKNREERNKKFMETIIDALEEASGKIKKSSSDKQKSDVKNKC